MGGGGLDWGVDQLLEIQVAVDCDVTLPYLSLYVTLPTYVSLYLSLYLSLYHLTLLNLCLKP